jgi:hypothetical protein
MRGYRRYFVKMSQHNAALEEALTRPEQLTIPVSGALQLTVEHVSHISNIEIEN